MDIMSVFAVIRKCHRNNYFWFSLCEQEQPHQSAWTDLQPHTASSDVLCILMPFYLIHHQRFQQFKQRPVSESGFTKLDITTTTQGCGTLNRTN